MQECVRPQLIGILPGSDPAIDRLSRAMYSVFQAAGGVASGDQVARMLRESAAEPVSLLARWIVSRQVVSFVWRSQTYLPLFQFDLSTMTVRDDVRRVVVELLSSCDDWELAHWFAQPNAWLKGALPVELVAHDASRVAQAARADRFIAMG